MPTNQNYDPRSGRAGGNYGGTGRRSSGGFGSQSGGLGSSGFGSGGGFGSSGSMGSGANVGQGFGNIDQSHGGTFGTGGLMGMGFNTRTTDGGRTRIGSDMYGNPTYQQNFNVLEGASGTPGGGRGGQIGIGGGSLPSYGGGISLGNYPQNNAGTSDAPNYQGGYGADYYASMMGGGYGSYGGPSYYGDTGGGPTASDGYGPQYEQMMNGMSNAPAPGGSQPQNLMDFINQYRSGVGASQISGSADTVEGAQGLIQQDNLQRQYSQNQGYINSLPENQQSNEQTAQGLGYLSYQAYLNANPGQTMPGAQGIPGMESSDPGNTNAGGFQRTPGPQVQPYAGQPSNNPQGSYDPITGTAYTPGWFGGGPSQAPQQSTSRPGAAVFASPPPAAQSPYPAKRGPTGPMGDPFSAGGSSGPQTQAGGAGRQSIDPYGAGGYAPAGSGRTGARGEIGPDGNPIPFEPPQEGGGIFQGGKGVTRTADQNPGLYGSMPQALTMAPEQSAPEGTRPFHPTGNQTYEGGIDMDWLGQDGRYLGGGGPLYGGQNSPQATHGQTGEQIMAPGGGGGGGGGFNPFGAVSRPEMTYPGGGTPQPNEPFFGGQNSPMVTNPTGETLMAPGFNPFGAVTRPEMTAYTPGWGGGPSQAPPQSGGYPAKQGPSGPMGDPLGGWSQRIPWNNGGTVNGRPGFDTRGYIPGKGYYMS